ncbi:MAG: DUF309 domain-containing protein [Rhizobiaceae bacterium]|nr:DUF309 domain-containing protein [Rhizobiaceae bacterium]
MNSGLSAEGHPTYAHIPGSNPRHQEDLFDQICASVTPKMRAADLGQTDAWRVGLDLYKCSYFWEAHEVLEAVWTHCSPNSVERHFVQSIIQIANARLKLAMNKPKAAQRLFKLASELFREATLPSSRPILGTPIGFVEAELQKLERVLNPLPEQN